MGFFGKPFGSAPAPAPTPAPTPAPYYGGFFGRGRKAADEAATAAALVPPTLTPVKGIMGSNFGAYDAAPTSAFTNGVPNWLIELGAQELPGGGFGGKNSWRVGDDVYTGNRAENGEFAGDFYKYKYDPQAWAGFGSKMNGTQYELLDQLGKSKGMRTWEGIEDKDYTLGDIATLAVGGVFGAAAAGALGGAAAGAGGGSTGAAAGGITGFGDAGLMYGGADAAAAGSLGGGASVGGGAALGGSAVSGGTAGGITGFGDVGTMYGGADAGSAASLGGGASVNGGAALGTGTGSMGAGSGAPGGGSGGSAPAGTPPPPNPNVTGGAGTLGGLQNILNGGGSFSDWLGLGTTLLGGYLGSQGEEQNQTSTFQLDPRLDAAVYGQLLPGVASTLNGQMPASQGISSQLSQVGSSLLGQAAPNTSTNPYVTGILDDLQRRQNEVIGTNLQGIKGNAVGVGGLGGSRQGVAQGLAISQGADNFTGQSANLLGSLYNQDQNRLLQQKALGAGLLAQSQSAPWVPLSAASGILGNFKSGTSTQSSTQGGGLSGALGGLLGGAQWAQNSGLFNGGGSQNNSWW